MPRPCDVKTIRLTALAEFDLAGSGVIVKAVLDDRFGPDRIAAHFGPMPPVP